MFAMPVHGGMVHNNAKIELTILFFLNTRTIKIKL